MRKISPAILALSITLALGACNRDDADATAAVDTPAPAPAEQASEPLPAPSSPDVGSLVVAGEGEHTYLADNSGRALYVLEGDSTGTRCVGDCLQAWPVVAGAVPVSGVPAVQGSLIGTTTRSDGTTQVTYAGQPLYYFASDTGPGMTKGHGLEDQWGHWYLVRPDGRLIEHGDASAMGAASTPATSDTDASATDAEDEAAAPTDY
jgi:predicted lipoprotein with Yx(FWY)xxD motif